MKNDDDSDVYERGSDAMLQTNGSDSSGSRTTNNNGLISPLNPNKYGPLSRGQKPKLRRKKHFAFFFFLLMTVNNVMLLWERG